MRELHVVLPNDIDDPSTPTGGNVYDRRVCDGLAALGWSVREHAVTGGWPYPDAHDRARLSAALATVPDGALVLIDGLIGSTVPDALAAVSERLQPVILAHMPLGEENGALARAEADALAAAVGVLTTSQWTRQRLIEMYRFPESRVWAAPPGVDRAPLTSPSDSGGRLLCVAAVTPRKGHDILVEALASTRDLPWRCVCVGSLDRDPGFAFALLQRIDQLGLADRITFAGPCVGDDLAARYADADLLVLASHGESYGMVVTESLARGVPVLATNTKGLPEALGRAPDGGSPGMLVPPGEARTFARALRRWLTDAELRAQLRGAAVARRDTLVEWTVTAGLVSSALDRMASTVGVGR